MLLRIPAVIVTSFIPEEFPMQLPSTSNLTDVPFAKQLSLKKNNIMKSKCRCTKSAANQGQK